VSVIAIRMSRAKSSRLARACMRLASMHSRSSKVTAEAAMPCPRSIIRLTLQKPA
jgi:hypothetical protein